MGSGAAIHRVDASDRMRENPDSIAQRLRMPEGGRAAIMRA
jgi:hypothetical protein